MNQEELEGLRNQILNDIKPLILETTSEGADKFSLLLRVIQAGNASSEVYKHAYESAKKIEDTEDRLNALMSLLDEVDFDVAQKNTTSDESRSEQGESQATHETSAETQVQSEESAQPFQNSVQ